ncbi:MAG: hypothetical protein J1F40_07260 [Prevotellaceae bacterium]|nr:hypothetical protein [Prevotellaceae bacterium]
MAIHTIHFNELKGCVCEICANCIEQKHDPLCFCGYRNDNFGKIRSQKDCKDFAYMSIEEPDDNDSEEFDPKVPIECPICGNDVYWNGDNYECECRWCGLKNDK